VSEASGLLEYHVSKEAVGKIVSFKCTPIRDDGIVGEARVFIGKDRVTPGACLSISEQFFEMEEVVSMS
jgi:hypothetical protein